MYLNTNSRALMPAEASKQYEEIARNLKEACRATVSPLQTWPRFSPSSLPFTGCADEPLRMFT